MQISINSFLCFALINKLLKKVCNKKNSELCFTDMETMSLRIGFDSVNKPNYHHSFVT